MERRAFSKEYLQNTASARRQFIQQASEDFLSGHDLQIFFALAKDLNIRIEQYGCFSFRTEKELADFFTDHHIFYPDFTPIQTAEYDWRHERAHQMIYDKHEIGSRIAVARCSDWRYLTFSQPDVDQFMEVCHGDPKYFAQIYGEAMIAPYPEGTKNNWEFTTGLRYLDYAKS